MLGQKAQLSQLTSQMGQDLEDRKVTHSWLLTTHSALPAHGSHLVSVSLSRPQPWRHPLQALGSHQPQDLWTCCSFCLKHFLQISTQGPAHFQLLRKAHCNSVNPSTVKLKVFVVIIENDRGIDFQSLCTQLYRFPFLIFY